MLRKMFCCLLVLVLALPGVLAEEIDLSLLWDEMVELNTDPTTFLVRTGNRWHLISEDSEVLQTDVIVPAQELGWKSAWRELIALKTEPVTYLARRENEYHWSYLAEDGRVIGDNALEYVSAFVGGIAMIRDGYKYGYLREDGTLLVEPQYDSVGYFYDGLARAKKDGKAGFIDTTGAVVIPMEYDYANDFAGDYAEVGMRGAKLEVDDSSAPDAYEQSWGVIDRQGNIVLPMEYDEIEILQDGVIEAKPKGADESVFFGVVNGEIQKIVRVASSFSLDRYMPNEGRDVAQLDKPASIKWDDAANLPRLDGATALFPVYSAFVQAAYPAETRYQAEDADADILVTCTKTNRAYERLVEGKADIIFCAGPSDAQVQAAAAAGVEFELTPFGKEAFVFIVNQENPLDEITVDEIRSVYSGKTTDWADLGVENLGEIIAYQRPKNSGSQTALEKLMGDVPLMTPPQEEVMDFMDTILEAIEYRNFPNAIGYTFRFFCTDMVGSDVKLLAIGGVEPSVENIRDESYPITSTLYAVTRKGETNPNVQILLDWIASQQGAELIEKSGYVAG